MKPSSKNGVWPKPVLAWNGKRVHVNGCVLCGRREGEREIERERERKRDRDRERERKKERDDI